LSRIFSIHLKSKCPELITKFNIFQGFQCKRSTYCLTTIIRTDAHHPGQGPKNRQMYMPYILSFFATINGDLQFTDTYYLNQRQTTPSNAVVKPAYHGTNAP
jgi:hypothetical protein